MAEFKKLSEVEKLETASDNATVLIEEGGEVKRVPKKEVGGGGEEMDIMLTVNASFGLYTTKDDVVVSEGSMEAVRTAFKEGRNPKGKVVFRLDNSNQYGIYGEFHELPATGFYFYGGYIWMGCIGYDPARYNNMHFYQFQFDDTGAIRHVNCYAFSGSALE